MPPAGPAGSARAARAPRLRRALPACAAGLERLPWPAGLCFTAYGARIGVRVSDAAVLPAVRELLPTGAVVTGERFVDHLVSWVVGGSPAGSRLKRYHLLYAAAHRFIRTLHEDEARGALGHHLELAVAEMARGRLFVHAGVVGWKGRAIVLPGASHAGKTSLVAALLAEGADYLSDEYAVVDGRGRVHPYPRPLGVRDGAATGAPMPAAALGARTAGRALPVGLVAVTRYEPGARWRPRPLTPARAVMELLANSVTVRKRPEPAVRALEHVAAAARALKGRRGEARDTARRLIENLEEGLRR